MLPGPSEASGVLNRGRHTVDGYKEPINPVRSIGLWMAAWSAHTLWPDQGSRQVALTGAAFPGVDLARSR